MQSLYAYNAGPLEFCQYPYTPERAIPFGMELQTVILTEDNSLRLYAFEPKIKQIEVALCPIEQEEIRLSMVSDGLGNWDLTIQNPPVGRYAMRWYYDGREKINRKAPVRYHNGGAENYVDVQDGVSCCELRDVPHGTVRQEYYYSKVCGQFRNLWVYTPASYDSDPFAQYPVLYLLCGEEDNGTSWIWDGKVNLILDNLIAGKKCREMLVVCACECEAVKDGSANSRLDAMRDMLVTDEIPFIEKRFRAIPGPKNRAIAGNSFGASQAQYTAFCEPELFGYVGAFSGSPFREVLEQTGQRDRLGDSAIRIPTDRLLYYGCGMLEDAVPLMDEVNALRKKGISAVFFTAPGGHEYRFWRAAVMDFAKMLFQ